MCLIEVGEICKKKRKRYNRIRIAEKENQSRE